MKRQDKSAAAAAAAAASQILLPVEITRNLLLLLLTCHILLMKARSVIGGTGWPWDSLERYFLWLLIGAIELIIGALVGARFYSWQAGPIRVCCVLVLTSCYSWSCGLIWWQDARGPNLIIKFLDFYYKVSNLNF